ncbi:energy-coupling factor ABC transporter ATP-binding protein [Pseudogracilibacillus sp. SO30301A]|uniref:energy-coupling factor ABC transporter ATP-binding protein n=1 Tax=Pseudogracilibacillus sp. SO30301A TaxID=3098291 RepID=UPI00300DDC48
MSIEVKNVTFSYPNGHVANEDLNFTIQMGERVAIVGQNGAGKTTAVKLLNGLHKPTNGDVLVENINTKEKTVAQISRYVGYVFQNPDDQIFNNTVAKELEYSFKGVDLSPEEVKKRIDKAVDLTGIGKYMEMKPFDIPYSIRKFVTIAVFIAMDTPYLILDEPSAGQDFNGINQLSKIMDVLQDEGKSVITITHDMEFVANNFNRVIAMANKRIIADDTPREIFWNEEIVQKSNISKTEIGELAKSLGIKDRNLLFRHELVNYLC